MIRAAGEDITEDSKCNHAGAISVLADMVKLLAFQHNTVLALTEALHLDVMAILAFPSNRPYDSLVPFYLLFLNHDDDACQYCKHWIMQTDMSSSREIRDTLKNNNKIFPDQDNSRYRDIFQDCPEASDDIPLHYLLALFVIKMRLVAKYQANNNIPFETEVMLTSQLGQLHKLRDEINGRDARILPSLTCPGMVSPGILGDCPGAPGTLGEFHALAGICALRVPGATAFKNMVVDVNNNNTKGYVWMMLYILHSIGI